MATWRCPNCGTVQVESTRCFVCQRSATSCGTCAMYRPSLVSGVGYCALDRKRDPLSGSEQRACWTATPVPGVEGFLSKPAAPPTDRGLLEIKPSPAGQVSGR